MPEIANVASGEIYKNAQPPKGMSLAEMLNLQKSSYELSKLKELYPAMIAGEQARSATAQTETKLKGIELEKSEQANKERLILQNWAQDPSNYLDKNGEIDLPKITQSVNALAPFTGAETIKKYTDLKQNQANANEAKTRLTDQQRSSLGTVLSGLSNFGETNPKVYAEAVKKWADQFPDDPNAQQLAKAYIGNLNYTQPGDAVRMQAAKTAQEYKGPAQQTVTVNGVNYQYNPLTNQLVPLGEQGQAPTQALPVNQPQTKTEAPALVSNEIQVPKNVNVQQLNTQQKQLYDEGFNAKREALSQVIPAKEGRQTVRRVIELSEKAASSKPGQLIERAEKAIFGNTELDELTKNLANLQIQNAAVMGVKTDQQTQNVATASGTVNISPEALRDIARRTDASNTAVIKFNEALKNYESKRGQTHAYINTRNFKDAWASNYDPRVFMVQNINASGLTKEKKQEEIRKITKDLSDEELNDLRTKTENIKRLERGDYR